MGKLESITTLATIAAGGLIFLKFYPLIEGFLKPSDGAGGGFQLPEPGFLVPPPTATVEDLGGKSIDPEVQAKLLRDNAANMARLLALETGGEDATPIDLMAVANKVAALLQAAKDPDNPGFIDTTSGQNLDYSVAKDIFANFQPDSQPAQQLGGQFWVNPLTQAQIAPYVRGQTPQAVLDLRQQDILPAIRGF